MWPSTSTPSNISGGAPYRPFESSFEDFRPNPFPSPEPPVPPPSTLSLSPPLGGTLGSNNNWSLSPPADDKTMIAVDSVTCTVIASSAPSATTTSGDLESITEAKMSEHHAGLAKGGLDDGRLVDNQSMSALYGGQARSNSSASSSPPASATAPPSATGVSGANTGPGGMLVVPQPINAAAKMGGVGNGQMQHGGGGGGGGSGRKYQCKMCPQIFTSKADLQLHTQIHMREAKPYKCSQCNKSFANSSYLSQHTRIHLGIKPYRCEICQRKFTQLSHLQQHIRTHTGDKPYKCRHPGCTKAFSQLSNLQSHSRCHQTDKPYKCNSCYKCFTDETALLEHIPKHKESKHLKTHICQYCGKSYTQETYLAKHMQKHSDRPDKRPPIVGAGQPGAAQNGQQNAHSQVNQSAASQAAAEAAAAAAYWPAKMDPYGGVGGHDRVSDYAQHAGLMAEHHRAMNDPRHQLEDFRTQGQGHLGGYGDVAKTSSAFSPIQTAGMFNSSTGFSMPSSRNYIYDPLSSFPKHHSQVGFDSKTGGANCFPNQLISLSQIRNYAHQPSSDLLHSLKEKAGQVTQ